MNKPDFSRRDFLSAGSVIAASAVVPSVHSIGGYLQPENKRGLLNVLDFGAKGDGTTDDTSAIQKALDVAGKSFGAIFIPEGNYLCGELKVPAGVGIHGLPAWSYRDGMGTVLTLNDEKPAA